MVLCQNVGLVMDNKGVKFHEISLNSTEATWAERTVKVESVGFHSMKPVFSNHRKQDLSDRWLLNTRVVQ